MSKTLRLITSKILVFITKIGFLLICSTIVITNDVRAIAENSLEEFQDFGFDFEQKYAPFKDIQTNTYYSDEKYGFKLRYPLDWRVEIPKDILCNFKGLNDSSKCEVIRLTDNKNELLIKFRLTDERDLESENQFGSENIPNSDLELMSTIKVNYRALNKYKRVQLSQSNNLSYLYSLDGSSESKIGNIIFSIDSTGDGVSDDILRSIIFKRDNYDFIFYYDDNIRLYSLENLQLNFYYPNNFTFNVIDKYKKVGNSFSTVLEISKDKNTKMFMRITDRPEKCSWDTKVNNDKTMIKN